MKHPDFWGKEQPDWRTNALLPASWLYHAGHQIRYASCRPKRAGVPVICVGNVTVGGTGKTPLSIMISKELSIKGLNPAIIKKYYPEHLDEHSMINKDTNNFGSASKAGRGDMNFETRTNTTREKNYQKRKKEKIIVVAVVEENGFLTKEEDSAKKRDGEDFKQV